MIKLDKKHLHISQILPLLEGVVRVGENDFFCICPRCGDPGEENPHHLGITVKKDTASPNGEVVLMNCIKCGLNESEILAHYLSGKKIPKVNELLKYKYKTHHTNFLAKQIYKYLNVDGKEVFKKVKGKLLDRETNFVLQDKSFRFVKPDGTCGKPKGDDEINVYNLHSLAVSKPDDLLVIVEGEKDVDTLTKLGVLAITTCNGAQKKVKLNKTEEELIAKHKNILIIPDNDEAGETYISAWEKFSPRVVKLKNIWKEIPKGGDITDFIEAGYKFDDVLNAVINNETMNFDEWLRNELPITLETSKYNFKIKDDGVYVQIKVNKKNNEIEYERFCCLSYISKIIFNRTTKSYTFVVYIDNSFDKFVELSPNVLASKSKIISLNHLGLDIDDNYKTIAVAYFSAFQEKFKDRLMDEMVYGSSSVEFLEDGFVGINSSVVMLDDKMKAVLTTCGDKDEWFDKVFYNIWGKIPQVEIIMLFALSSLMNGILKQPPVLCFINAPSQFGKTPALRMVGSMFGSPSEMINQADSTPPYLNELYHKYTSLPLLLDDWEKMRTKSSAEDIFYSFCSGQVRGKMVSDDKRGGNRWKNNKAINFYSLTIVPGETRPNLNRLGAQNRCIIYPFPKLNIKTIEKILPYVEKNYGWFVRDFLENYDASNFLKDYYSFIEEQNFDYKNIVFKHRWVFNTMNFLLDKLNEIYDIHSILTRKTIFDCFKYSAEQIKEQPKNKSIISDLWNNG